MQRHRQIRECDPPCDTRNKDTALIKAARSSHNEVVEILVDAGAKLDLRGKFGVTALMASSSQGFLEVVTTLVRANASPAHQDYTGRIRAPYREL